MFKLYFYARNAQPELVFSNAELQPCLDYIRSNRLCPQQCMIVTPNNRRVTFNQNNCICFSEFVAA
jgi:hypothetical protein